MAVRSVVYLYLISAGVFNDCQVKGVSISASSLPASLMTVRSSEFLPLRHLYRRVSCLSGQGSIYIYLISTGVFDGCQIRCLPLPHLYRRV